MCPAKRSHRTHLARHYTGSIYVHITNTDDGKWIFWETIQVKSYDVLFPCNLWSMTLALDMFIWIVVFVVAVAFFSCSLWFFTSVIWISFCCCFASLLKTYFQFYSYIRIDVVKCWVIGHTLNLELSKFFLAFSVFLLSFLYPCFFYLSLFHASHLFPFFFPLYAKDYNASHRST